MNGSFPPRPFFIPIHLHLHLLLPCAPKRPFPTLMPSAHRPPIDILLALVLALTAAAEFALALLETTTVEILEGFLDVDFELDDVVEDAFGFGVEFFAQGVGPERELFVSGGKKRGLWLEKRVGRGETSKVGGETNSMLVFISRCSIS